MTASGELTRIAPAAHAIVMFRVERLASMSQGR